MKTPSETLNFISILLMHDPNFLAITLQQGILIQTPAGTTVSAPNVIELIFDDINESDWFDALNKALKDFLQDQPFKVIFGNGDTMLVFLPLK